MALNPRASDFALESLSLNFSKRVQTCSLFHSPNRMSKIFLSFYDERASINWLFVFFLLLFCFVFFVSRMSFVGQFLAVIELQSHHISDLSSTQNACHVISLSIKDEDLVGVRRVLEISTAKTNEDAKRKYSALWVPDHEVLDERMRRTMVCL